MTYDFGLWAERGFRNVIEHTVTGQPIVIGPTTPAEIYDAISKIDARIQTMGIIALLVNIDGPIDDILGVIGINNPIGIVISVTSVVTMMAEKKTQDLLDVRNGLHDKIKDLGLDEVPSVQCFPSTASISTTSGDTLISALSVGDLVLSFSPLGGGQDAALTPCRVTRLFHNITDTWIKVSFPDHPGQAEITATPGHHMAKPGGGFAALESMIRPDGSVSLVAADGSVVVGRAERIIYSAETALTF